MIKSHIIGRLGRDAEEATQGQRQVLRFRMATDDREKDASGQWQKKTVWVAVSTGQMGLKPYLTKGKQVLVSGDLHIGLWHKSDGNVELDIAQSALLAAKQRFSGFNFTSTGGTSILPASMKTGDKLEDIHACVAWGGVKYTIDYTSRKVLRRETITVPAGTFDCVVVSEHKVEKAPFLKRDRTTLTWYALGVGMVRHDTFLPNGEMETSEKLNSIKKN